MIINMKNCTTRLINKLETIENLLKHISRVVYQRLCQFTILEILQDIIKKHNCLHYEISNDHLCQ